MTTQPDHVHRWIVETPHDGKRMLDAACACGAERQFPASGDDPNLHSWQSHVPGMQRAPVTYIFEV